MVEFSRLGIEPQVYLGGERMPWKCLRVTQSAGGHNLDMAFLEFDHGSVFQPLGDPLHDYRPASVLEKNGQDAICQVVVPEGPLQRVIHHGRVSEPDIALDGREARIRFVSRLEPWMFGVEMEGYAVIHDPEGDEVSNGPDDVYGFLSEPLVFNPLVDGRMWGNLLRNERLGDHPVHPGQMQSDVALRALGFDPEAREPLLDDEGNELPQIGADYWRLSDAVIWALKLNSDQRYVENPSAEEVREVFELEEDDPILRHVDVRLGWYLPQVLDRILLPYGYSWRLQYRTIGQRPRIEIFKLGMGFPLAVSHQRYGETLDPTLTTMKAMRLRYDAGDRFVSRAKVYGSPLVIEGTWELVRAWDDSTAYPEIEDLRKSSERYQLDPTVRRIGRDFVLNEAGDYAEMAQPAEEAEEGQPQPEATPPESPNPKVREVLTRYRTLWSPANAVQYVPRRRRFLPCVTIDKDGAPIGSYNGVEIEYSLDGGDTWQAIVPGGDDPFADAQPIVLLEREAGIRFEGEYPASLFLELGATAKIRITASLVSDIRLGAMQSGDLEAPADAEVLLELPQYQWRVVDETSIYSEKVQNKQLKSLEAEDLVPAEQFAEQYVKAWNHYDCDGNVILEGCDREAQVGYLIPRINGRNIDLSVDTHGRAPQVMAVTWDFAEQQTILLIGTPRQEVRAQ